MAEKSEIVRNIDVLLQEYAANEKTLEEISSAFRQKILPGLDSASFSAIHADIKTLFGQYQADVYHEAIDVFNRLLEEFEEPPQTIVSHEHSSSVREASFYDTHGQKAENLTLDSLKADKLIDGRYQLLEKIGSGGMAVVWKALDKIQEEAQAPSEARYIAIKFIDSTLGKNMFASTVREANRTRSLKHDNIVTILSVGKTGGLLFIVMELLQRVSLKALIHDRAKQAKLNGHPDGFIIPHELGMKLSRQIAGEIAYAHFSNEHKKGILHLDLKPENIFYNPGNDVIKVLDFGLARYAETADNENTAFKGLTA